MTDPKLTLESAYREFRGLMFRALAKLASQGFAAQPADAADLVHDFFVEAWDGIKARFDPQRAALGTYVYAAFVRFARRRIVRTSRQRAMLLDPAELIRLSDESSTAAAPEEEIDMRRLAAAVAVLPAAERAVLYRWVTASRASERQVARELGTSRYELRQRLIEAFGHLGMAVGMLKDVPELDRKVALAVWRDKFTLAEAALRIGVPPQRVRNAYARNQRRVEACLALVHRSPNRKGESP